MSKNTEAATREWVNKMLEGANVSGPDKIAVGTAFTKLAKDLAKTKGFNPDHIQDYQMNENLAGSNMLGENTEHQQKALDQVNKSLQRVENVLDRSLNQAISKNPNVCALMSGFNKMASNIMKVFGQKAKAAKYSQKAEQYSEQATKLGANEKTMEAMRQGAFQGFVGVVKKEQSAIKIQDLVRGMQLRQRTAKTSKTTPSSGKGRGKQSGRGGRG